MSGTKIKIGLLAFFVLALIFVGVWLQGDLASNQYLVRISQDGRWLLPLVVISSLLDSINPCAFSVLLLTIAFLASIGRLRSNILKIGTIYIAGLFLIYLLIGLGIIKTLTFFGSPHFMGKLGASLLVVFGMINLVNEFFPRFPIKLRIPQSAHNTFADYMEKGSMPAAFVLGILVGLFEFPCTGGPYLVILGLLHDSQTYLSGLAYLVLYNFIFVSPLVVILLVASDKELLNKVQIWQQKERRAMKFLGGLAMIILGLIIYLL